MRYARSKPSSLVPALFAIVLVAFVLGAGDDPPTASSDGSAGEREVTLRRILDEHIATVAWPNPRPIDPLMYAEDIEGFWSNGQTYNGRDAFVEAMKVGVQEAAENFANFAITAEDVKTHVAGESAWLTCVLVSKGALAKDQGEFNRKTRSTFVFEKRGDRWQMVHEHSSRIRGPRPK